ncbi:MAG TPA: tripartite tricarboxylate transporter substrate binding protein [Burkholderiales bacterium]|nr:tripartite tricarboxylate transporter substrate binding protein [Burkholderiales bacterium]
MSHEHAVRPERRRRKNGLAVACTFAAALLSAPAVAQDYPSRPIRMLIGFNPGGSSDVSGRAVARKMSEALNTPIVIENRSGAGGNIAADITAKANPDGYTLFWSGVGPLMVSPALGVKLSYDPFKDFVPVGRGVVFCNVLIANQQLPANNVKELIALARAKPGSLNYATPGIGSAGHLGGELLKSLSKTDIVHIAFKGGGEMITNLIGGQVQLAFVTITTARSFGGSRVKVLAVTSAKRDPAMPEIPTMAEGGVPGYDATFMYGLVTAARTPPAIVARLNKELRAALGDAEVNKHLGPAGLVPAPTSGEEYGRIIRAEYAKWYKVLAPIRAKGAGAGQL